MPTPYWIWPVRLPAFLRRGARSFMALPESLCTGQRWAASAAVLGAMPFFFSYATGWRGHQAISAILLVAVCANLLYRRRRAAAIGAVIVTFAAHSAAVIGIAFFHPEVHALLPGAEEYWQKQVVWITTGQDPEYQIINWLPAHLGLLFSALVLSYTSLGGLIFYQGFYEVDLMNFYTAQLMSHSTSRTLAVSIGWHLWSLLRGAGYTLVTCQVVEVSLFRMIGLSSFGFGRKLWALAIALLVADGLAKATLLETVRQELLANLVR